MFRCYAVLFAPFLLLGLTSCFSSGSSPFNYLRVTQLDRPDDFGGYNPTYACVSDRVQLRFQVESAPNAVLSANPADALEPALNATQVSGEGSLNVEVRAAATLTLDTQEDTSAARLELIPSDICTGFPADLLRHFSGTLMQETPTPQALPRQLTFYWRDSRLEATLTRANEERPGLSFLCDANPAADTVRCSSTNTDFTLDMDVGVGGLTGEYVGSVQDSVSEGAFSGTLNFKVVP